MAIRFSRDGYLDLSGAALSLPAGDWTIGLCADLFNGNQLSDVLVDQAGTPKLVWRWSEPSAPGGMARRLIVSLRDDAGATLDFSADNSLFSAFHVFFLRRSGTEVSLHNSLGYLGGEAWTTAAITMGSAAVLRCGANSASAFAWLAGWGRALGYYDMRALSLGASPRFIRDLAWHVVAGQTIGDELGRVTASATNATEIVYHQAVGLMAHHPSRAGTQATAPRYTLAGGPGLPAIVAALSGDHAPPVYGGAAAVGLPLPRTLIPGDWTKPLYAGTAGGSLAAASLAVPETLYADALGHVGRTLGRLTHALAGQHAAPIYAAPTNGTRLPLVRSGLWAIARAPRYESTPWLSLRRPTAALTATHSGTPPTYSGSAAVGLPAAAAAAQAASRAPRSSAAPVAALPAHEAAATGSAAPPLYSGLGSSAVSALAREILAAYGRRTTSLSVTLASIGPTIVGQWREPTALGVSVAWLPAASASITGSHTSHRRRGRVALTLPAGAAAIAAGLRSYRGRIAAAVPQAAAAIAGLLHPGYHSATSAQLAPATAAIRATAVGPTPRFTAAVQAALPQCGSSTAATAGRPTRAAHARRPSLGLHRLSAGLVGVAQRPIYADQAADLDLARAVARLSATAAPPCYPLDSIVALARIDSRLSGEASPPVFGGPVSAALPATRAAVAGSAAPPCWTGVAAAGLPPAVAGLDGLASGPTAVAAVALELPAPVVAIRGQSDRRARGPYRLAAHAAWQPAYVLAAWQPGVETAAAWQPEALASVAIAVGLRPLAAAPVCEIPAARAAVAGTAA